MVPALSTSSKPRKIRAQFKKTPSNPRQPQPRRHRTKNRGPPNPPMAKEENVATEEDRETNGVLRAFREEQMGRNVFLLAVPISAGFLTYYNPMSVALHGRLAIVAVSVGATAIWNGILLRRAFPRAAGALELIGVAFMLLAFFGFLGSRLPGSFRWLPLLCFVVALIPIAVGAAVLCRRKNSPEDGDAPAPAGGLDMV